MPTAMGITKPVFLASILKKGDNYIIMTFRQNLYSQFALPQTKFAKIPLKGDENGEKKREEEKKTYFILFIMFVRSL